MALNRANALMTIIEDILNNLIGNALKFTETGEVALHVRRARELERDVPQASDKICLEFIVQDTGIGIPQDKIADLFERFEQIDNSSTRRFGGTCLAAGMNDFLAKPINSNKLVTLVRKWLSDTASQADPARATNRASGRFKAPETLLVDRGKIAVMLGDDDSLVT